MLSGGFSSGIVSRYSSSSEIYYRWVLPVSRYWACFIFYANSRWRSFSLCIRMISLYLFSSSCFLRNSFIRKTRVLASFGDGDGFTSSISPSDSDLYRVSGTPILSFYVYSYSTSCSSYSISFCSAIIFAVMAWLAAGGFRGTDSTSPITAPSRPRCSACSRRDYTLISLRLPSLVVFRDVLR